MSTYKQILEKIRPLGFDEVGRFKTEGLEVASIACEDEPIVIPYAFHNRIIILEKGDESEIDQEIEDALMRWIEKELK